MSSYVNLSAQLKDFQIIFLPHLESFFDTQRQKISSLWPLAQDMFEKLAEFTLRNAKRTRPALLYYSYQGLSKENPSELMPFCIACELMQSFLLIHDDIMDQADTRRGGKTIHQQFEKSHQHYYGESMGILIGNLAGYLGLQAISQSHFEASKKNALMSLYAQICIDAGYGQALDITFDDIEHLNENNIYNIYRYKTARYTTEFPLITAAILANAPDAKIQRIKQIAVDLGILFQIKDDIIGIFGDEKIIGKPLDMIPGKKTLLICKAFELGNDDQKTQLKKIYNSEKSGKTENLLAKKIIEESGALTYAEKMMQERTHAAFTALEALQLTSEGEIFLKELIHYYSQRDH